MKRRLILSTFAIATLCISGIFYFTAFMADNASRADYEARILEAARALEPYQPQTINGEKAMDQPDMAAFQEFILTMDPKLGYVPERRIIKAYEQTKTLMEAQKSERDYDPVLDWQDTDVSMGGRTRTLMFDPNDSDKSKLWAGSVTGGLWYNDDITSSSSQWQAVDDFWPNLAISCMAYDPTNTQTMYVGTGEAQTARIIYRKSSGLGAGIYKTTDGGLSWNLIPSTADFAYVTDVVVRSENGVGVIYAAVVSGIYMGEDHESMPSELFRSDDGGDTWSQVLPIIPGSFAQKPYSPSDIEISANGRIFVGTMENLNMNGGATILYSDSGLEDSWTTYDFYNTKISSENYYNIPARTIIAVAPSNPNRVYAQFAAGYENGFTYYRGRYMATSTDGGLSWNPMTPPSTANWATLAWHAFILQVDPNNEEGVITGGLDLWKISSIGQTWRHVSDWSLMYSGGGDAYVHADQHNIQFRPENNNNAVFSSDGGVFFSETTNLNYPVFKERNNSYNTLQFYSCAIDPTPGSENYIGGLQDNGTLHYSGGIVGINDMIDGGDGAFCFWDNNESSVYITSVYYNRYSSWYNNTQANYVDGNSGTFISPADYDYKLNNLYANAVGFSGGNANKILRITGVPWTMNDQLVNIGTSTSVPFSHIKYSRFSPQGTSTIFVGTSSGKLFKVENINSTPNTTEIGSPDFPNASISCVDIGKSEDTLLVTFSNYGVSSVWQTYDAGLSWQEKEGNLPDMPIRWCIYHPQNNGQALLATETGIWATNTLKEENTEWAPAVDGMANVRIDMLQFRNGDNIVLAATHGRGLFTAEYNLDIYTGIKNNNSLGGIGIFPNPANDHITLDLGMAKASSIKIFDIEGRLLFNGQDMANNLRIDVSSYNPGTYIAIIKNGDGKLKRGKFIVE
ncbi:MAG: T9SS type A sorting domain-containing protein [Chlorobi bacterium]|nr:T9SS type A sorting domain-containing protein [Chlorobiota bacterium]